MPNCREFGKTGNAPFSPNSRKFRIRFSQIFGNLRKSGKDNFKAREVNKGRTELDNQKGTIARIKKKFTRRSPLSAPKPALFGSFERTRNIK